MIKHQVSVPLRGIGFASLMPIVLALTAGGFPSPCGELALHLGVQEMKRRNSSFRPLAGNWLCILYRCACKCRRLVFPSPCGELALHPVSGGDRVKLLKFPSPCGELALHLVAPLAEYKRKFIVSVPLRGIGFASRTLNDCLLAILGFRPLAGNWLCIGLHVHRGDRALPGFRPLAGNWLCISSSTNLDGISVSGAKSMQAG